MVSFYPPIYLLLKKAEKQEGISIIISEFVYAASCRRNKPHQYHARYYKRPAVTEKRHGSTRNGHHAYGHGKVHKDMECNNGYRADTYQRYKTVARLFYYRKTPVNKEKEKQYKNAGAQETELLSVHRKNKVGMLLR